MTLYLTYKLCQKWIIKGISQQSWNSGLKVKRGGTLFSDLALLNYTVPASTCVQGMIAEKQDISNPRHDRTEKNEPPGEYTDTTTTTDTQPNSFSVKI